VIRRAPALLERARRRPIRHCKSGYEADAEVSSGHLRTLEAWSVDGAFAGRLRSLPVTVAHGSRPRLTAYPYRTEHAR
jgi:hypothetical protein